MLGDADSFGISAPSQEHAGVSRLTSTLSCRPRGRTSTLYATGRLTAWREPANNEAQRAVVRQLSGATSIFALSEISDAEQPRTHQQHRTGLRHGLGAAADVDARGRPAGSLKQYGEAECRIRQQQRG